MKYSLRPQYSLAALLFAVTGISVALAAYRYLNPPVVYPVPAYSGGGEYYSYAFDRRYVTEITERTFDGLPLWDRHRSNPPLSANAAMVAAEKVRLRLIAQKKLRDEEPTDGAWHLMAAELTPYDATEGKWFWVIRFEYVMDQTGPPNELELFVLMDGKVLEPTITETP